MTLYSSLASHLDRLPGGFPPADGLELRILQRLFTPAEAALAVYITLLPEAADLIAFRAGLPEDETARLLEDMAAKGLIYDIPADTPAGSTRYVAASFVVGIWEMQLNRLTPGLVQDVDAYLKATFPFDVWSKVPQLRTIPIGAALDTAAGVLDYERAEALLRQETVFSLSECICRKERGIVGEGCGKPLETCLGVGSGAEFYIRHDLGRAISREQALMVIEAANRAGLVLQPSNAQKVTAICCCCGDCCAILRNVRRHPEPARVVSSGYYAIVDVDLCVACGDCETRCPMGAVAPTSAGYAEVNGSRCIGCGLCVSTCAPGALSLRRKPQEQQRPLPQTFTDANLRLARERGVFGPRDLAKLAIQSKHDRARMQEAAGGQTDLS
jgi:Pyruvate/2-oxoacid:ferredoxin oxidoreductase delta subunit